MHALFEPLRVKIPQIGTDPGDSPEVRLEKTTLVIGSILVTSAALLWGILFATFQEFTAAGISLGYSAFTLLSLLTFQRTHNHRLFLLSQLILGLTLPFAHTIVLGGFWNSSGVIIWSFISPLGALIFFGARRAQPWWIAFGVLLLAGGILHPTIQRPNNLPGGLVIGFFVMNLLGVASIVLTSLNYFIRKKDEAYRLLRVEEQKTEDLLLNILPREIAGLLKDERRLIAESFSDASILFADLVGFTRLTTEMPAAEVVRLLNEIFSHFDTMVEKYDVEKIRTIGDNYMVVAGVPRPVTDHAQRLAYLALDMRRYLESRQKTDLPVQFRIGINSGPVIGGVIGHKKFVYDVWGDAVNIASRMESQGVPGKIQITEETYNLLQEAFICTPRGEVQLKGRGVVQSWFLEAELE